MTSDEYSSWISVFCDRRAGGQSRPEVALDAQDAGPHVVVLDVVDDRRTERCVSRNATRAHAVGLATRIRRLDPGVDDLKTDIEVGHRIPDRARAGLPRIPVRTSRTKAARRTDECVNRVAARF